MLADKCSDPVSVIAAVSQLYINRSEPIGRLYPEGYLCPMQHGPAVQEFHDAGLDRRRSIVREYDRRDNHVAAVIDDD